MHLQQVHMENFKSFGSRLTVPFEEGFTGITGPNGSGKSNIGDAILFVLGPNSPRAIRAGRLTDLIFNGGATGKPATQCLVSLTFDNTDRTMPVDADEVTLTRKVKRNAKKDDPDGYNSYFYVNGRASRKKEFVDLLNHARISADGYNITQQGDVLQICRMTNMERRRILDDIAGVTTFDRDIDGADKRRSEVEENLERIGIVLEEIEGHLRQLEKDKDAAQKYLDLTARITETKGLMAWRRKSDLEAEIAQVQSQISKYTEDRAGLEAKRTDLQASYKEAQQRFVELEQQIRREGGEEVEKIQNQVSEARDRMVRLEEKINFAKAELHGGDEDLLPLRDELRRIEKELKRTRELEVEATKAHDETTTALEVRRKELEELRDRISQSDQGAMALNRDLGKLKLEHEEKSLALHDGRLEVDRIAERRQTTERAMQDARAACEGTATDLKEVAWELEELRKQTDGSGKQRKETERRLFELRKAQAELTQQNEDLEQRIRRLQRELSDLQAQEAAAARASGSAPRAVEALLAARDQGTIKGIVGTIAELANAEGRFQTALETAAGANMHALVVEDDSVAAACIDLLKRDRIGRAKLLPLNKMVPGRPRGQALMKVKKDGCLGFALDLIDFNDRYHGAFWQVFGDTLVVDTMTHGRALMGGVRMVTLEGELFEAGGAMIGGARDTKKGPAFSGSDRSRIDELLHKVAEAESAQEQTIERLAGVRKELASLQEEMDSHGRSGQSVDDRLKELEKREARLKEQDAAQRAELERLESALAEATTQADEATARVNELEARLSELEALREEKGQLMLKGSKKEWRERMEQLDRDVRSLHEGVLEARNRRDVAAKQAELVESRRVEVHGRIEGFGEGRQKHEFDLKRYTEAHKKAAAEVAALMQMERKATAQLGGLRDKKDKVYEELSDLKVKMEKVGDRMETHYGLIVNAKSKLPGLEETLGEALVDLQQHPVTVAEGQEVPSFDDLRRNRRELETRLERLGPVNQRALEEYDAQSARKADLDAEVARLRDQREELVKLVAEITTRKKASFMEVYTAVNENFAAVYADLSLGGKALMELENDEDPFQGGLILKAQPMGKRVTRLDALSGGEKSLTSMAFIFAIQRYDPSPFYYFDEVDQNLDAVNSELLARMIRRNAQYAQFIVVSLRKITLKEASHMYGVTQQVAGLSEVIANFDIDQLRDDQEEKDGTDDEGSEDDAPGGARRRAKPSNGQNDNTLSESIRSMIQVEVHE